MVLRTALCLPDSVYDFSPWDKCFHETAKKNAPTFSVAFIQKPQSAQMHILPCSSSELSFSYWKQPKTLIWNCTRLWLVEFFLHGSVNPLFLLLWQRWVIFLCPTGTHARTCRHKRTNGGIIFAYITSFSMCATVGGRVNEWPRTPPRARNLNTIFSLHSRRSSWFHFLVRIEYFMTLFTFLSRWERREWK